MGFMSKLRKGKPTKEEEIVELNYAEDQDYEYEDDLEDVYESDQEYEYEDDLEYEDTYEEEPAPAKKRGLFGLGRVRQTEVYEDDEYYDDDDDEYDDDEYEDYDDEYLDEFDDFYDDDLDETDEERYERIQAEKRKSLQEEENEIKRYYELGLSMEEIERIEYNKSKKESIRAEVDKQRQDRHDFFESFSQPATIFGFLGFYVVNVAYLTILTNQIGYAMLIGLIGAFQLTKWFIFKEKQLDIQEADLKQLEGLANDISFESQAGKNVFRTFQAINNKDDTYFGRVEDDIRYTYKTLERETILDLTNFETYNFTPFNLFLRNVSIWYTEGVPVKQMFDKSIKHINFEIVQRNKLRMNLQQGLKGELITVFISLIMPLVLRLASPSQYQIILAKPVAISVVVFLFYIIQIKLVTSMKKRSLDITIR